MKNCGAASRSFSTTILRRTKAGLFCPAFFGVENRVILYVERSSMFVILDVQVRGIVVGVAVSEEETKAQDIFFASVFYCDCVMICWA